MLVLFEITVIWLTVILGSKNDKFRRFPSDAARCYSIQMLYNGSACNTFCCPAEFVSLYWRKLGRGCLLPSPCWYLHCCQFLHHTIKSEHAESIKEVARYFYLCLPAGATWGLGIELLVCYLLRLASANWHSCGQFSERGCAGRQGRNLGRSVRQDGGYVVWGTSGPCRGTREWFLRLLFLERDVNFDVILTVHRR